MPEGFRGEAGAAAMASASPIAATVAPTGNRFNRGDEVEVRPPTLKPQMSAVPEVFPHGRGAPQEARTRLR